MHPADALQPAEIESLRRLVPVIESSSSFCILALISGNVLAASKSAAAGVGLSESLFGLVAAPEPSHLAAAVSKLEAEKTIPVTLAVDGSSISGDLALLSGSRDVMMFLANNHEQRCAPDPEVNELREQVEILRAAFDASFDGLCVTDGGGNVLLTNRSYERATGWMPSVVSSNGRQNGLENPLVDCPATIQAIRQARPVTTIVQIRNGNRLITTASPVIDENGAAKYVVVNARRIDDLLPTESHWLPLLPQADESRRGEDLRLWNEFVAAQHARGQVGALVGNSPAFREVIATSVRAAEFDTPILIQGESGVGKGLLANLIHHMSARRDGPFVEVNCGAIPETLLESELFGYEKGAFTDARSEGKKGWVELANNGTLFLDEVSELPLRLQVKLLKFLDDMTFMPVGAVTRRKVNVKILAASNTDLAQLVASGQFRQDLFFRIDVLPIVVPPLRERREDIPLLIEYFLKVFEKRYAKTKSISGEAVIALMYGDYTGNVRQLRNIIERVFIMTPGDTIGLLDLPVSLRERAERAERNLHERLREYERDIIESAVRQHRTTHGAAAALGVNQSTIVRKLQSYRRAR